MTEFLQYWFSFTWHKFRKFNNIMSIYEIKIYIKLKGQSKLNWHLIRVQMYMLIITPPMWFEPVVSKIKMSKINIPLNFFFFLCPVVLFSFGHCVVCSSPIYGFWLLLWYLQTLLNSNSLWLKTWHNKLQVWNCQYFK
jgi:hypothetical protein